MSVRGDGADSAEQTGRSTRYAGEFIGAQTSYPAIQTDMLHRGFAFCWCQTNTVLYMGSQDN